MTLPWQRMSFLLSALITSTMLGLIVGASFLWADPQRAWDNFLGGTLWVLLVSAGTGLARCFYERIQRNAWRRGIIVGLQMALFPMTLFLVSMAVTSAGAAELVRSASGELVLHRPDIFALAPICYGVALTLGLVLGPSFALTSPFGVWR